MAGDAQPARRALADLDVAGARHDRQIQPVPQMDGPGKALLRRLRAERGKPKRNKCGERENREAAYHREPLCHYALRWRGNEKQVVGQLDTVVKGHDFSRAVSASK